jgi:uncharacterized OB-fold protein
MTDARDDRDELVLPDVDDPDGGPFWSACAAGELRVQACASCGRRRMPPRPMCPWCRSFETRWDLMAGTATVWSVVVPHPPLLPAYAEQAPYNVVVVTLDDDPSIRLVGNVVEHAAARLDSVDPSSISIGDRVEVAFAEVADGVVLPRWKRR